jgi:hypothetical protein
MGPDAELSPATTKLTISSKSANARSQAPIAAASALTLIETRQLNDVDQQAWLADVLARINDHAIHRLDQLLPWNWKIEPARLAA